ncbi:MAG: hypothetical protein HN427_07450 [Flavobacteriales bacterium]|jgi:hypothetical protein|nr:hypothetical protein [Flavobacteriales bacterium]MBT7481824.1 hypothetical protein [Flavobacteriales bacterium]
MEEKKELFKCPEHIAWIDGDKKEDIEKRIEEYNQLTINEKILLESLEQTRKINKIYANIQFWFWLTMISIVSSIYILFIA